MKYIGINHIEGAVSIAEMSPEQRPRERCDIYGPECLSDDELICVLLGSGAGNRRVQELAHDVSETICSVGNCIPEATELEKIRGIGFSKARQIVCAIELGRRLCLQKRQRCDNSEDAFSAFRHFGMLDQEHFLCMMLNGAREIMGINIVSVGLVNRTLVHPREVFSDSIRMRCTSVIVGHNHPSGNLEPSPEDIDVTERLVRAGEILGIKVIDHLIFSFDGFYSMKESGVMP